MTLDRRTLLKLGLGAGAGLAMGRFPSLLSAQDAIVRKAIPSTGEQIPVIGLGSSGTFNLTSRNRDFDPAREVIRLFKELGGTVIDTSPTYQRSEEFIGQTVRDFGIQDDLFLATKVNVGNAGKPAAMRQMEESSRVFGKQQIDLMQVWNLGDSIRNLTDNYLVPHMEVVAEWKAAGRARNIGITTSRDPQYGDVAAAMEKYPVDFVQLDYSIGDRIPEQRLLPLAEERGIAVLVNRPFGSGNLFGRVRGRELPEWAEEIDCNSWAQYFLKFLVSHPAVTCAIPATSDPEHLRDNMGAGVGRMPDAAMRARMITHFEGL
jgi:diketogulonate reductase-like aldo/keto reductase